MSKVLRWLKAVPEWLWAVLAVGLSFLFVRDRLRRERILREALGRRTAEAEAKASVATAEATATAAEHEAARAAQEREIVAEEVHRELEHIDQASDEELSAEYLELARRERERRGLR